MDVRIPPLRIKIMLESNPLKSIMLVRRLAVHSDSSALIYQKLPDLAECQNSCSKTAGKTMSSKVKGGPGRMEEGKLGELFKMSLTVRGTRVLHVLRWL